MIGRRSARSRDQRGAAPVEFVAVMSLVIPLLVSIVQVGIFLYARNTLTACAYEGAREAANYDRTVGQGLAVARNCVSDTIGGSWASTITPGETNTAILMTIDADMPPLGIGGLPTITVNSTVEVVKEPPV